MRGRMPNLPGKAKQKAKEKLRALLKLPKQRPHPVQALFSVLCGTSLSWGVEVFDADKVKEQAIQEATNTGLLTALLLTISAGPLLGEAPGFLDAVQWRHDVWFLLWFLSTMFLGLATIVAVMQNILFATLSGEQIRYFHDRAGVMMHAPLLLFVTGTMLLLAAVCFGQFYAMSQAVFIAATLSGGVLLLLLMVLITEFSLWSYDCYVKERQEQEEAAGDAQENDVQENDLRSSPVQYIGSDVQYVGPAATVPVDSIG